MSENFAEWWVLRQIDDKGRYYPQYIVQTAVWNAIDRLERKGKIKRLKSGYVRVKKTK
jgi:hypothetical protein